MEQIGNRLFAVEGPDGKKEYFDLKTPAKTYRNALRTKGYDAHVTYGPDHPSHKANRKKVGWNKGKHPRRKAKGSQAFH